MPKKRCWSFKKECLDENCDEEFEIKLEMTDREAYQFNQRGSYCTECSKRLEEERQKELEKKGIDHGV